MNLRGASLAAIAMCLISAPVVAQSGNDEIIVTAQKRAENVQDVPISITALPAQVLEAAGIDSMMDITQVTPSLNFSQTSTFAQPYIRGIGTDSFAPGNEASVATYVDGVYYADMGGGLFSLNNIERIEVLKGPQGTLYGRNSTGGLINVVTRTPSGPAQAEASLSYGNFNTVEGKAYIGGGMSEGLAGDVAISFRNQGEGYYLNKVTGNDIAREEGFAIRSKVVVTASDAISLTLIGDLTDYTNTLANTRQPGPDTVPALIPGTFSTEPGVYFATKDLKGGAEQWGFSGRLDLDLGKVSLVSITAYRENEMDQTLDADDSGADFAFLNVPTSSDQFTQEVHLISDAGALQWIAGVFYQNMDAGWDPFELLQGGVQTFSVDIRSATKAYGVFGQLDFELSDRTGVTVGARYNHDKKDYRSGFAPNVITEESWSEPTWRLAVDHRFNEDLMGYASYSRGYKSGAYNTTLTAPHAAVDPEIVDAFEVGFKSDLFDNRLRLNGAAFYTDFQDIQVRSQSPDNTEVLLQNAASAEILGVELEAFYDVTPDFTLRGGVSILDAEYKNFDGAPYFDPKPTAGNTPAFRSAAGNSLSRTPKWTANIAANYEKDIGSGSVFASANLFITDDIPWDPSNRLTTDGYHVLNGTIGWRPDGEHWSIELWAKNLTDELYENYVVPSESTDRFSYAQPRTYGVRVGVSY